MTGAMFVQHALNGLTLGSLYALIAIGYTMVYGILRLINFAHSEIFMLGAYFVLWGITLIYLPWFLAIVGAVIITASVGVLGPRGLPPWRSTAMSPPSPPSWVSFRFTTSEAASPRDNFR